MTWKKIPVTRITAPLCGESTDERAQADSQKANNVELWCHDDAIKWKHFPRYWPFVRGIHRGPVNSPYKGQWRGALMFPLICVWINGWVNNREAGDLRRYRTHYDVTLMYFFILSRNNLLNRQSNCWLFETPLRSCGAIAMSYPQPDWIA